MNTLDRLIAWASPEAALRRAAARSALGQVRAAYDGASRTHRTAGRRIASTSADAELWSSLQRLRDVSRDMERNNVYAARAFQVIPTDIVGAGIVPALPDLGKRTARDVKQLVAAHLETSAIDYDGRQTLYGLQLTAVRAMARDGEALLLRVRPRAGLRLSVPLQVRLLEADYLDASKDGAGKNGAVRRSGVEFDASGRRVAYHLFKRHPGDPAGCSSDTVRVPADDVIHLYRVDRPGQTRGVPWIAPAIMTLWDLKDYEEAELLRQRVAACFAAFRVDLTGSLLGPADAASTTANRTPVDVLEPATVTDLAPGQDIRFATPPQVSGYPDYVRMSQRRIATGIGIPFNVLASDDSQENFSSSRRGHLVYQRTVDVWRWQTVIPTMCDRIGEWFLEACAVALARRVDGRLGWTPPKRDLISPKEEIPAMRDMVRNGFQSRSETIRSLGYDPEAVEAEIAAENERADGARLSFDSDGRRPVTGPEPAADPAAEPAPPNKV